MSGSPVGDLLSSFSTSYTARKDYQRQKEELAAQEEARRSGMYAGAYAGQQGGEYGQPYSPGGSGPSNRAGGPMSDPVSTDMPSYQRAFLNSLSEGEAPGGAYNVRYSPNGGVEFDLGSGHPRVFEPTHEGKRSSAAGRYQFTWTTWKGLAGEDTPFTEANQDHYAWQLAVNDYGARTGRNLAEDLQSGGMTNEMMDALAPTWASFNGDRQAKMRTYADSLARYQTPAAPVARTVPLGYALGTPQ